MIGTANSLRSEPLPQRMHSSKPPAEPFRSGAFCFPIGRFFNKTGKTRKFGPF